MARTNEITYISYDFSNRRPICGGFLPASVDGIPHGVADGQVRVILRLGKDALIHLPDYLSMGLAFIVGRLP